MSVIVSAKTGRPEPCVPYLALSAPIPKCISIKTFSSVLTGHASSSDCTDAVRASDHRGRQQRSDRYVVLPMGKTNLFEEQVARNRIQCGPPDDPEYAAHHLNIESHRLTAERIWQTSR
jgi:hypothetical protein